MCRRCICSRCSSVLRAGNVISSTFFLGMSMYTGFDPLSSLWQIYVIDIDAKLRHKLALNSYFRCTSTSSFYSSRFFSAFRLAVVLRRSSLLSFRFAYDITLYRYERSVNRIDAFRHTILPFLFDRSERIEVRRRDASRRTIEKL